MEKKVNWKEIDKELSDKFEEIKVKTMMGSDSHSSEIFSEIITTYLDVLKNNVIDMEKGHMSEDKKDIINSLIYSLNNIDKSIKFNLKILKCFPEFDLDRLKVLLILDAFTESLKTKYAHRL